MRMSERGEVSMKKEGRGEHERVTAMEVEGDKIKQEGQGNIAL